MIITESDKINYKTRFSNSLHSAISDTTVDKGGNNSGFRPHELLEAALASCMNMQIRMFAENHNMEITNVKTIVSLNRTNDQFTLFEYKIEIEGPLTVSEKEKLINIAGHCPVNNTLSKNIEFKNIS